MEQIIIYTAPTCVYYKITKGFFKANNVPYEEKDVIGDVMAREEMIKKSRQMGVPVILLGGEVVIGFGRAHVNN